MFSKAQRQYDNQEPPTTDSLLEMYIDAVEKGHADTLDMVNVLIKSGKDAIIEDMVVSYLYSLESPERIFDKSAKFEIERIVRDSL